MVDGILVLDYGGQYCHLIARRIRELSVYSEIAPGDISKEEVLSAGFSVKGLILSGGPASVFEGGPAIDRRLLDGSIPVLGICYGHQLIAHVLGGKVSKGKKGEFGTCLVSLKRRKGVLKGLKERERVWMSHRDIVIEAPEGFSIDAFSDSCPIAAFSKDKLKIYGIQWHPEVVHTENGVKILKNFVFDICKCSPEWKMEGFVEKAIDEVREIVGSGKAIVALSGGVDSSTAAMIAYKALKDGVIGVFVDHGLMRAGEAEEVMKFFEGMGLKVIYVNASSRFFNILKGVKDPEEKRRLIGNEFVRVFEEVARDIGAQFLIQGTIYPDRVESGRGLTARIKTHHNVAGLPEKMKLKVIEPLKDLYKDEVRAVARELGLPREIIERQPFPGPGLAVRVLGEVTPERVELLRKADKIVREEIEREGLSSKIWQFFAVLLNDRSTGVKGDIREYGHIVAIRAVESVDAMTAKFSKLPYDLLERISTRITNEVAGVTRVVYDVTHKPPSTIEWE